MSTQPNSALPPHPSFRLKSLRFTQFASLHIEMIRLCGMFRLFRLEGGRMEDVAYHPFRLGFRFEFRGLVRRGERGGGSVHPGEWSGTSVSLLGISVLVMFQGRPLFQNLL